MTVCRERRGKIIRVEGCKFNVKDASLDILKMFTRIQKEETEKQLKIKDLAKEVSADNLDIVLHLGNKQMQLKYYNFVISKKVPERRDEPKGAFA